MKSKSTLSINLPKERVLLSEVSPFEVPITFSNRGLYKFSRDNKLSFDLSEQKFKWLHLNDKHDRVVRFILGLPDAVEIEKVDIKGRKYSEIGISKGLKNYRYILGYTIPYNYKIIQKADKKRTLSILHPYSQLMWVSFYDKYKDLIIYYMSKSKASLRKPVKISACKFIDRRSHLESYKQSNDGIEMLGENYENLKSFFTYRDIDNIYKFFESDIHINAEKKFYKMVSLDITKCFPSIYTHSIAWAINSKEHAKRNIGSSSQSFPSIFDSLIQKSNYNETNGILVGPEISRIFAELILQDIDDKIIKKLEEKGLSYSDGYVFYRYVDDIFLFYNNDIDKNIFIEQLESELEQYKLHLNSSKIKYFSRPLITPISVAKNKISKILNECFSVSSPEDDEKLRVKLTYKSAVRDFKTLMYESEVDFVDITSYSISIIENKSKEIYKSYIKNKLSFDCIFLPLESIINFSFYLFSSHPTVNTAIKLCRVIKSLLSFLQEINYPKELVYKLKCSVFDNSVMVLENHKGSSLFIEKSYLLVLLKQLGKSFWLDEKDLLKFVVPKDRLRSHTLVGFDYFCFISLIFYMENKVRYKELRELVIDELSKRFNDLDTYQLASSEVIHLVIDLCSCPYLEEEDKVRIFSASSIDLKFIRSVKNSGIYFTSWVNFDLIKELDAKRSYAVY